MSAVSITKISAVRVDREAGVAHVRVGQHHVGGRPGAEVVDDDRTGPRNAGQEVAVGLAVLQDPEVGRLEEQHRIRRIVVGVVGVVGIAYHGGDVIDVYGVVRGHVDRDRNPPAGIDITKIAAHDTTGLAARALARREA